MRRNGFSSPSLDEGSSIVHMNLRIVHFLIRVFVRRLVSQVSTGSFEQEGISRSGLFENQCQLPLLSPSNCCDWNGYPNSPLLALVSSEYATLPKKERNEIMVKKKQESGSGRGPQPQWQPISLLPTFAYHLDGMLEVDLEQYETLLEAKPKPYVLDDDTVNRVLRAFTTQKHDFWLFEEQLRRWNAGSLSDQQRQEVHRLIEQMRLLRENNERVVALSRELQQGTLEKQLAKDDAQVGLDVLLRHLARDE